MCRLAAYCGPQIPLENIIVAPRHSLLQQSYNAEEAKLTVNGDGFGIAWYNRDQEPGLYRSVLPAWSDNNLSSICRMVRSRVLLAHVRASTSGGIAEGNCHPFSHGKWSFMHNGKIAGFTRIRRILEASLPDHLYNSRKGTTDSELLFLLLLANDLENAPDAAFRSVLAQIAKLQDDIRSPNRLACVFSDGETVFALRHSSDAKSPSLYVSKSLDNGGCAVASEPLDGHTANWRMLLEDEFLVMSAQNIQNRPLFGEVAA